MAMTMREDALAAAPFAYRCQTQEANPAVRASAGRAAQRVTSLSSTAGGRYTSRSDAAITPPTAVAATPTAASP